MSERRGFFGILWLIFRALAAALFALWFFGIVMLLFSHRGPSVHRTLRV